MQLRRDLVTSALAIVVLTIVLGIAYPLAVTGVAQVAWPNKADGSQITIGGRVVGSKLLSQPFVVDTGRKDSKGNAITRPDPRYFQPRPSQDAYNPAATFFSNRGPNQASARSFFRGQLAAYIALEQPYDPALSAAQVPVDAVTTSGSGVDPHISQANARIQAHRVAAVRRIPPARVSQLIADHTDGRFLGVLGEPGVNVTTLNLALDALA
ncbi:MAG TPA: potassium-transporting ATPase subunit C [Solirubrobacteraceae bacterium]|jgi:K+-transporting ATPase ATPase C chain|nr:potassium-transporting ATPase subunit C [Solirubrobacteraceae bacterium]